MKRRIFLQKLAASGIILPVTMGFPRLRAYAKVPEGSQFMQLAAMNSDKITILIRLAGGNDGLNTVVPYTNSEYYKLRQSGEVFIKPEEVLPLKGSSTMGLHPALAPLQTLYNENKVAIIQNVGYPNQNFSHFRSTDIWLSGTDANVYESSGWYGRFLEEVYPDYPEVLPKDPFAIELGTYLSSTLIGRHNNMGIAVGSLDYVPGQPDEDILANTNAGIEELYVRDIIKQTNLFSNSIIQAATKQTTNKVQYPSNNALANGLSAISRIIMGGLQTQMYIVNISGYDTHNNQLTTHAALHKLVADAVLAFQRDLEAFGIDKKVCIMTISEFGRRANSNGAGTDHGSAAPMFVIGSGVNGSIIGSDPNLNSLEGAGNIKMEYDFRQVYASLLGQWYNAKESQYIPSALPRAFAQLPIFKSTGTGIQDAVFSSLIVGQNYPNPASTKTIIPISGISFGTEAQFILATLDGRTIHTEKILPGNESITVDISNVPPGSYSYIVKYGQSRYVGTMLVHR